MNFDDVLRNKARCLPTNVTAIAEDFTEEEARNEMRRVVHIVFGCEMLLDAAGSQPRAAFPAATAGAQRHLDLLQRAS